LWQKIRVDCAHQGSTIDLRRPVFVLSGPQNLVHKIPRLARPQLLLPRVANHNDQLIQQPSVDFQAIVAGHAAEYLRELSI
jgi:hypothetical protein